MGANDGVCPAPLAVAALLLLVPLGGCVGSFQDSADTAPGADQATDLNPWQAGLDDDYPTPDVAKNRSRDERRSNVAEPGSEEFAAFDAKIRAWMETHNVSTGQLALMKDGKLRYARGYGYTDPDATEPANASTMFRIASVTKPITAALVALQVEQGLYNWSDPVFCLGDDSAPNCRLPIEPHPNHPVQDERIADIQVRHLLAHECGYGPRHDDLLFSPGALEVAEELGIQPPPSAWRSAQYVMGRELMHAPGQTSEYSNVCYMLAGLVAEAATGTELGALYDAYLFDPLEIADDIEPGRTLVSQRNPREPFYPCEYGKVESVFDPNETVCRPNGSWSMRTQLAYGGLVATAEAVATVYEAHPDHVPRWFRLVLEDAGQRLEVGCSPAWTCRSHTGGMPGTATSAGIVEGDGWQGRFVFLFNSRIPWEGCDSPAGGPFGLVPLYNCSIYDLQNSMFYHTAAWARAEEAGLASAPS